MTNPEAKSLLKSIIYQQELEQCRKDFKTKGIKFFDKHGWGYIRNGTKHYQERQ